MVRVQHVELLIGGRGLVRDAGEQEGIGRTADRIQDRVGITATGDLIEIIRLAMLTVSPHRSWWNLPSTDQILRESLS